MSEHSRKVTRSSWLKYALGFLSVFDLSGSLFRSEILADNPFARDKRNIADDVNKAGNDIRKSLDKYHDK